MEPNTLYSTTAITSCGRDDVYQVHTHTTTTTAYCKIVRELKIALTTSQFYISGAPQQTKTVCTVPLTGFFEKHDITIYGMQELLGG